MSDILPVAKETEKEEEMKDDGNGDKIEEEEMVRNKI